ncbi:hypothetical protein [Humibacillus xanthopallidus]|uniref:XRE family transcriptional regulator n=1 Tax=Humibacillus xanthopallidus TaxID=412689 RepID=A0A543H9T4_9MICO|nr:hypothetical protein [Humibacillus xanthopallidus]TQM55101.1 hypothetical protein FBY41_4425 [Humibacillus xanthopallidus]
MTILFEPTSVHDLSEFEHASSWDEYPSRTPTSSSVAIATLSGWKVSETPLVSDLLSHLERTSGRSRAVLLAELSTRNFVDAFTDVARRTTATALASLVQEMGKRATEYPRVESELDSPKHAGANAWEALAKFFNLANADVSRLVGVSEQTYYNWLRNPDAVPRPVTLRRLLRLRAALTSLTTQLGPEAALHWFTTGTPSRLSRMADGQNSFETVMSEATSELRAAAIQRLRSGTIGRAPEYGGEDLLGAKHIED